MKYIINILMLASISVAACKTGGSKTDQKTVNDSIAVQQPKTTTLATEENLLMPPLKDTGQQYFHVRVWKKDSVIADYGGEWAYVSIAGNNFNMQMAGSKQLLKISHLLVLYFNSPAVGTFPIVPSGNEKGKPTLIFTPVIDDNYGLAIAPGEGKVDISAYTDKTLSGSIEAKGKDENGDEVIIKAAFINIKK
jgi:hypothetical protein